MLEGGSRYVFESRFCDGLRGETYEIQSMGSSSISHGCIDVNIQGNGRNRGPLRVIAPISWSKSREVACGEDGGKMHAQA